VIEFLAAAAAFGLSGGLSPGPLLALVVSETLKRGRRAGFAVAAAPLIVDAPIIAAAVLLLGRIEDSGPALGIINLAGAALLASWGINGLRGQSSDLEEHTTPTRIWGPLAKGAAVNLLNPSPYLFWLTIGAPTLLRANDAGLTTAALFLVVFYLGLVGSKVVLAALVARSRAVLRGRPFIWANRALAVVLLVYAALFVRSGLSLLSNG
jgi:threonine/homoserine/homoserine lactone efflux protein